MLEEHFGKKLSSDDLRDYHSAWRSFRFRYEINDESVVHNNLVVISRVFQFDNKPLFRAHVFNNRLRKKDPYNLADSYLMPFWHSEHYLTSAEQLYHASMGLLGNNQRLVVETGISLRLRRKIFWNYNVSVEFFYSVVRETSEYVVEDCFFKWYDDHNDEVLATATTKNFATKRAFLKELKGLEEHDTASLESLIRKIKRQEVNLSKLKNPRKNLLSTADLIINDLRKGIVDHDIIADFFSFWDSE